MSSNTTSAAGGAQTTRFVFNGDYKELEQVAGLLPRFSELYDGGLFYNADFAGRIPELAGPDEETGIYLLQGLRRSRINEGKLRAALAAGYAEITRGELNSQQRFESIILLGCGRDGRWTEYAGARIVFDDHGHAAGVLGKGKRSRGQRTIGRRVIAR